MGTRILIITLLLSSVSNAQVGIGGSILGYVFDPLNGVQPLLGIPGAATIGPPLELPVEVTGVTTSSQSNYVLARTATDPNLARVNLNAPVSLSPLGVSISAAGLTALSATGSAVASYDQDRKSIAVYTGLPDSAVFAREFDLSSFAETPLALAVDDSGEIALVSFSDSVVALGADGSVTTLGGPRGASAMKFLNRRRDAVIADRATAAFYLVRDLPAASETTVLAEAIEEPVAVAVSNDNKRVFVASASRGEVTGIDLTSGAVEVVSCFCKPSALVSLSGNAIFRLTEPSGSPLWVFDGDSPESRIVFIPPYRPVAEEPIQ